MKIKIFQYNIIGQKKRKMNCIKSMSIPFDSEHIPKMPVLDVR